MAVLSAALWDLWHLWPEAGMYDLHYTSSRFPALGCRERMPWVKKKQLGFGFQRRWQTTERRHPTCTREKGLAHPADTSRSNLAAALGLLSRWRLLECLLRVAMLLSVWACAEEGGVGSRPELLHQAVVANNQDAVHAILKLGVWVDLPDLDGCAPDLDSLHPAAATATGAPTLPAGERSKPHPNLRQQTRSVAVL
jgi:hypothetical protein